jgi:hypothetical protein
MLLRFLSIFFVSQSREVWAYASKREKKINKYPGIFAKQEPKKSKEAFSFQTNDKKSILLEAHLGGCVV